MSSRDGVHWDRRFLEAFVRPGRDRRDWVHRNRMVAVIPLWVPRRPVRLRFLLKDADLYSLQIRD